MKLCGIDVHPLPYIPGPEYPPIALAYVQQVAACIGPTDAVEITQSYECTCPLIGRILHTSFDKEEAVNDEYCPPHPYITNKDVLDGPVYFKVQIYLTKEFTPPAITESWPHSDHSIPYTITAAAPSNCVLWIHSSQILNVVFLPHVHHVVKQTYGNLSGRVDMYYVQHNVHFGKRRNGEYQHYFSELEHSGEEAYNMFDHPSNRPRVNGYISYSERIFHSVCQVTRLSDSMLIKMGAVNQQVTKKMHFPRESWNYVLTALETRGQHCLEFSLNHSVPMKVKVTTDNLTLSVDKVNCTRYVITAKNVDGFDVVRSIIGRVGCGVKKKHPNLGAINKNDGSNRLTIQEHDLIHIVDLDESEVLYRDESVEDLIHVHTPTRPQSNFIRISYDTINQQLCLTVKCYSTLVSLLSDDAKSYLRSNNVVTGNVFVLLDNRVWKVSRVDRANEKTLLCDPDDETESIWVDNAVVVTNEVQM